MFQIQSGRGVNTGHLPTLDILSTSLILFIRRYAEFASQLAQKRKFNFETG